MSWQVQLGHGKGLGKPPYVIRGCQPTDPVVHVIVERKKKVLNKVARPPRRVMTEREIAASCASFLWNEFYSSELANLLGPEGWRQVLNRLPDIYCDEPKEVGPPLHDWRKEGF